MFQKLIGWLKSNKYASVFLLVLRLVVGWEFLNAGLEKIKDGFDATAWLQKAITNPVIDSHTKEVIYPNMVAFLKHFALPNVGLFNHLVPWGEFAIGLGLILGCLTTTAIFFAMFMCFMFAFSGTVSTTPWVFLLGMFLIVSGDNAGAIGLDRWVQPYLRAKLSKKSKSGPSIES